MSSDQLAKYTRIKKIGAGTMGSCTLVRDNESQRMLILKSVDLSKLNKKERSQSLNEARTLSLLRHPNVINYHDSFLARKTDHLCIVMEYADGGDLGAKIKSAHGLNYSEDQVLDWMIQTAMSLLHVHSKHILHRDVKSANIFLTSDGLVKLGDFGIARTLTSTIDRASTFVGTPYYLSPELILEKPYDYMSDVWAFGVIVYEMMALKHPFNAGDMKGLMQKILRVQYDPLPGCYSQDLRSIVQRILVKDPGSRLKLPDLLKLPIVVERMRKWMSSGVMPSRYVAALVRYKLLPHGVEPPASVVSSSLPMLSQNKVQQQQHAHHNNQVSSTTQAAPLPNFSSNNNNNQHQNQQQGGDRKNSNSTSTNSGGGGGGLMHLNQFQSATPTSSSGRNQPPPSFSHNSNSGHNNNNAAKAFVPATSRPNLGGGLGGGIGSGFGGGLGNHQQQPTPLHLPSLGNNNHLPPHPPSSSQQQQTVNTSRPAYQSNLGNALGARRSSFHFPQGQTGGGGGGGNAPSSLSNQSKRGSFVHPPPSSLPSLGNNNNFNNNNNNNHNHNFNPPTKKNSFAQQPAFGIGMKQPAPPAPTTSHNNNNYYHHQQQQQQQSNTTSKLPNFTSLPQLGNNKAAPHSL